MPAISIIIPIYKVEKYLRRCLDSVANQSFTDWEAICVNDGSPDGCGRILEDYSAKDPRFKIINKENGGLSDARNAGMQNAEGEYIIFLDSDDLIHPQTMEISYYLAKRDGSDMVTWYKDKFFRPLFLLRRFLGLETDKALPFNINRRFSIDSIKSKYTEDIFAHAYESSKNKIEWPVKRCYAWRTLMKRELIKDIFFVKGLKYEDFPWWSELLLKNPKTTITNLPFYYYFPNPGSILMSTGRAAKMRHKIEGIIYTYNIYKEKADTYKMSSWKKNFLWPYMEGQLNKKLVLLKGENERQEVKKALKSLAGTGLFQDDLLPEYKESAQKIIRFIES